MDNLSDMANESLLQAFEKFEQEIKSGNDKILVITSMAFIEDRLRVM
jgi:hypothetical protein